MGMRWDRCWFENCHERGAMRQLAGHERNLCETHAAGIQRALEQPGTFHVSWGRSKAELLDDLASKRGPLAKDHDAAEAALSAYEDQSTDFLDPERDRLIGVAHRAFTRLEVVDDQIGQVNGRTWDHPVVRVRVATESR